MTKFILIAFCVCIISGCAGVPKDAFLLEPSVMANRQMESRIFATKDKSRLLKESTTILESMGYKTDIENPDIGLITATKHEDKGGFSSTAISILTAGLASTDKDQAIKATFTAMPSHGRKDALITRLTLQRMVLNSDGEASSVEQYLNQDVYKLFYERLEASTFAEMDQI